MLRALLCATGVALGIATSGPVMAQKEGKTTLGTPFVVGGVSQDERQSMQAERKKYSLLVQTAARTAGAFVSDATVTITDKGGKAVLDTQLDGPWLLVNLPLGQYKVAATYGGKTQAKQTTIHKGDNHEMVFYFDEQVDTLPKGTKN
jgi:hypothetical protein